MPRVLSLRARLAGAFLLIVALPLSLIGMYLLNWTGNHYRVALTDDLRRESRAIASLARDVPAKDLPALVGRAGRDLGHRITIIRADGQVIADSEHDYRSMPSHSDRPEVRQALATGVGAATRSSDTLKTDMLYVATSFGPGRTPEGVARIAEPLSSLREVTSRIQHTFLLAALAALILAAVLSIRLASGITAPIESAASAARKLAAGDLSARAFTYGSPPPEVRALAAAFNQMAGQLQSTVQEITEQKTRMQTLFERAVDGLVLVGPEARISMVNPAACRMLRISGAAVVGKTVIEGTLSHDMAGLVDRAVRTREPASLEICLPAAEDGETVVHAYVDPIARPDGGADVLIVLHDITAARRLEAVRRDFVANVSHELRTPLASIRAMAETILLRRESDPSVVEKLSESIVQETDRLNLLARDLLELVKAESGRRELNPRDTPLDGLVSDVFSRVIAAAQPRAINLVSQVAEVEMLRVDRDCLFQILLNLVDNAVNYTPDGGSVAVSARRDDGRAVLQVTDDGIGIPEADIPRVFERFYRVDRARSRESGGTGLGLSIVKHLTELLGGSVSVASEVGNGTTFTVTLPAD